MSVLPVSPVSTNFVSPVFYPRPLPITLLALAILSQIPSVAADEGEFAQCVDDCKNSGRGPVECFFLCLGLLIKDIKLNR